MLRFRLAALLALLLSIPVLAIPCLAAQVPDSTHLALNVTDATGAAIPGASIHVRDASGALAATADVSGVASLAIPLGSPATLLVQAPGFRDQKLQITGGVATLTVQLQVLATDEAVEVDATGAAAFDSQETQAGVALETQQVAAMPVNGRSLTDLLAIAPGVVPASSAQPNAVVMSGVASTPPSGDLNIGALSVSGQRETGNAFSVNGAEVQEDVNMGIAIVPTLDSVSELKVLTDSFEARLGSQSGGHVFVSTRSGGDRLHGSVYDYFRNTALDARSYFSLTRAPFHQNQFGGTLGGPAPLHGVHYFADYQGTRQTQGINTGVIAVPTLANRLGNLADSASALSGTVSGDGWASVLTSRLGYSVLNGEPYYRAGCTTSLYNANAGTGCVFPNATIPTAAWSAPAQKLLQYIPTPNLGASSFSTSSYAQTVRDDKGALRLDLETRAGQLALYSFVDDYSLLNPYPTGQGGATVPGFNARNDGRAQLSTATLTSTLRASLVNAARLSYMRNAAVVGQPLGGQGVSLASQGFVTGANTSGIAPQMPSIEGVENVVFNDFTFGTTVTGLSQAENMISAADDFTWSHGAHLFTFGASFHTDEINTHPNVYDNGSFSFTGSETGLDFADFLLGIDSSYTQGSGQNFYNRNHYLGLYAQDSWHVSPRLVLNYGLRWDVLPPWSELHNQLLTLDPSQQSVVFPNAPQGILFPGDPGVLSTISPTRYNDLAPRVAVSWSPQGRFSQRATVVRAGFGLYYSAFEGLSAGIMSGNPPYGFTDTTAAPTRFDQPFVEAATNTSLGQPFPLPPVAFGASSANPISSVDWTRYEPLTGIPAFAKNNVSPYTENYTLSVERELTAHTRAKLGYMGTQAHHQLVIQEANPGNPALCLALSQTSQVAAGSATCGPFNESSTFTSASGVVYQGTRSAFSSAFGSVNLQKTIANSHDNALEAELEHSTRSLFAQLSYTWSKSIDQSSSLAEAVYPGNAGLSRALSAFDMRHNFAATYRVQLPLQSLFTHARLLTEGWQLAGLTRVGTGFPVTLVNNNDTSLLGTAPNGINGNGIDEPQFTPGNLKLNFHPGAEAFNTGLFSLPELGAIGNARRRFFSGPGMFNTDLSVAKVTHLHDDLTLELRAEAFNIFNHSQFFGPAAVNGNISSANFGQIQSASSPRLMQLSARIRF